MKKPEIIGESDGMPVWDVEGLEPFKMDKHGRPIYKIDEDTFTFYDGEQMGYLDMCSQGVMTQEHLDDIWDNINKE